MRKGKLLFWIPVVFVVLISFSVIPARASIFDNLVDTVKQLSSNSSDESRKFSLNSKIELLPDGDLDKNNVIDAGDIVKFSYTITNNTDKTYKFASLHTNLDRSKLSFIHNIKGSTGINDDGKAIVIANLLVNPQQVLLISFEARVNYFQDTDLVLSTSPEFFSEDGKFSLKSDKKEALVKKISKEKVKSIMGAFEGKEKGQ